MRLHWCWQFRRNQRGKGSHCTSPIFGLSCRLVLQKAVPPTKYSSLAFRTTLVKLDKHCNRSFETAEPYTKTVFWTIWSAVCSSATHSQAAGRVRLHVTTLKLNCWHQYEMVKPDPWFLLQPKQNHKQLYDNTVVMYFCPQSRNR